MKLLTYPLLLPFLIFLLGCETTVEQQKTSDVQILPPEELYDSLFYDVQSRKDLFADSKTFVDCVPKRDVADILEAYNQLTNKEDPKVMMAFLKENFEIPEYTKADIEKAATASLHIQNLWPVLRRSADSVRSGTLIPLENPYIVPGGRFREVYYWDSFFTILGLQQDGKTELIDNILSNFSNLIDTLGFVPNGNRTYYLTRSQPPFYAMMVDLHVSENNKSYSKYLPFLEQEHAFWMAGKKGLDSVNTTHRRVVYLGPDEVLNRYWDDRDDPRAESYREDIETTREAVSTHPNRSVNDVYRDLRAAAESGWDFSTRWFAETENGHFDLSKIHTTDIIPVDLNALLYFLENTIAKAYRADGEKETAAEWQKKADLRKTLIMKYCWNSEKEFFMDYDYKKGKHTPVLSLAGMYPLYFGIASPEQAKQAAEVIKSKFLKPGGVVSTLNRSGQQWDYPNGWAPLQWMTIQGLENYEHDLLAENIRTRWLKLNDKVFANTGKMMEKYNVADTTLLAGGGEYPNQDGFGWTNGVYRDLVEE